LYGGAFLPGEFMLPPVVSARARLHSVFVRALVELGQRYELAGLTARAMDLYRRGLEIDGCAEEVARRLMQVCRGSGRAAEGVAAYRRCEAALQAQLGVQPSAATQSALRDLLALTERDAADHRRDASAIVAPVFGAGPADLSIAIRPFGDLSPQGDHQRLADAIRETTISLLGTLPQLSLVTRPSSAVRYLLQGSVMVVANCLRATVHLIDARTGQHAWSEQLDYSLHDVNKARDQVAIQVARGLTAKLIFGECATLLLSPNIHVWKALTLVGVLLHRQHRQDHLRARALVSRILEVEQQEPLILALHATMHIVEHWKRWTVDPARSLRIGEQMLRQLKKKYAFDGLGVQSLAWACALRGDFDEALHHASKGVDRTPENFSSHTFLAIPLLYQGRHAEALDKLNDAVGVCPQPPHWIYKDRAVAQFCLGRYDEAANGLATVLADKYSLHRHANLLDTHMIYVASLAAAGRAEQARHEARATVASHPSASAGHWCRWQFQPYKDKDPALRMERLLVAAGLPQ
jgi:TolB-like protein/Flp pilus assembly protein TadD